ncbi:YczE/YyaS/YitT family protein [Neobacillus niacini]|uniref:YczE/YyaS/YitT family protein n=1 Tax=Neobacillus niacini TaxID=86668 RepID=UPI003B01B477
MVVNINIRIRFAFYMIGILLLSFGISCSVNSQLGAAPMPSLQVGLQQTIGLTVGSWEFIIGAILVTIMAIVRRNRPDILAFLTSFLTGLSIDMWLYVTELVYIPEQLPGKILFLCFGLLFMGLGVSLYLQAKFSPAPPDGMILLLEEIWKMSRSTSRTLFSLAVVTLGFLFSGPVGIGTFIMVVSLGPIVAFFYPKVEKLFIKLKYDKQLIQTFHKEG